MVNNFTELPLDSIELKEDEMFMITGGGTNGLMAVNGGCGCGCGCGFGNGCGCGTGTGCGCGCFTGAGCGCGCYTPTVAD